MTIKYLCIYVIIDMRTIQGMANIKFFVEYNVLI